MKTTEAMASQLFFERPSCTAFVFVHTMVLIPKYQETTPKRYPCFQNINNKLLIEGTQLQNLTYSFVNYEWNRHLKFVDYAIWLLEMKGFRVICFSNAKSKKGFGDRWKMSVLLSVILSIDNTFETN